jgi:hypothetical protein
MNREFYLLIILGIMMVSSSFGVYHFATAQVNSSNIGLNDTTAVQPSNITSSVNNTQNEVGAISNANNWTIISGNWTTQGASIHGGSSDNTTSPRSNIVLNPETLENASKVSTTFKINSMDNSVANYAWIVFSFTDPDNYRLAGINILKDTVYAVGYTVTDGNLVAEPFWPGIPTDLTHTPDSTYNITLVKQDSSLQLLVNGTAYLTQSINNQINLGQVGLDYGRVQDVDIVDFKTMTGVQ